MKAEEKRKIANLLLDYFEYYNCRIFYNTTEALREFSEAYDVEMWNVWKGFDLLKDIGNIELNSPNGRKGFKICSYERIKANSKGDDMVTYEEYCRIPLGQKGDFKTRIVPTIDQDWVVVDKKKPPKEVFPECTVEIKKSQSNSGYYVLIKHEGNQIMALGINPEHGHFLKNSGYNIVPAEGATISFNIYKK